MNTQTNIMLDLETLGVSPGCSILSIGAVTFDQNGVGKKFYQAITQESCERAGLVADPDTVAWWKLQSPEAQEAVFNPKDPTTFWWALGLFEEWLSEVCPELGDRIIWGCGAAFDNAILAKAYVIARQERDAQPWKFWNDRCYRTVKALHPDMPMPKRVGTHHNALDDAESQALHLITLPSFQNLFKTEEPLIAAAPDLLEALEEMLDGGLEGPTSQAINQAYAAIAKAKGKKP